LKVDGRDVEEKIEFVRRHYANSTQQALMWRAMWRLLDGPEGTPAKVMVQRVDGVRELKLPRSRKYDLVPRTDRAGEVIRLVADGIGYADLDRLPPGRVNEMFERFKDCRAIIMDMRGYPHGTAFQIAPRLTRKENLVFAQVRRNRVTAGESQSEYSEWRLGSRPGPKYAGQTVMLIDESAVSQAEHSGLMFRAANGTKFIGTPTMGANGDVTSFLIPGGISISSSAHDVRHADGSQLQRVGLLPDIEAHHTIAGVRSGRDEILERAIKYIQTGK
jgi:C-terminal processing protease CtpA/Prc